MALENAMLHRTGSLGIAPEAQVDFAQRQPDTAVAVVAVVAAEVVEVMEVVAVVAVDV